MTTHISKPMNKNCLNITLPKIVPGTPDSCNGQLMPLWWDEVIFHFLHIYGIWSDKKYFDVDYNSCYHFYDISIFPDKRNINDTAESVGKKLVDVMVGLGKEATDQGMTWRWETREDSDEKVMIYGRRIWIKAESTNELEA